MSAKNDITGDAIASKANSKSYRDNYENIFAKKATEKRVELDGGICNSKSNDGCRESQLREYAEGAGVQGQADQEQAVAWLITHHENQPVLTFNSSDYQSERFIKTPLYAHPPKREPLSDEDVVDIARRNCGINFQYNDQIDAAIILAHEIEKAHGINDER
jgi:hypothetical protein